MNSTRLLKKRNGYFILSAVMVITISLFITNCSKNNPLSSNTETVSDDVKIDAYVVPPSLRVYSGYTGGATCTAEPNMVVRVGPGLQYARSTLKPSIYFNEKIYVDGTEIGSDGRLYVRFLFEKKISGCPYPIVDHAYADTRWLMCD
jgi:hypothetical protein